MVSLQGRRVLLDTNVLILATGLQNNCTDFYTTDKVLLKQASRLEIPMAVHNLPSLGID